jgi:hypothetical protein
MKGYLIHRLSAKYPEPAVKSSSHNQKISYLVSLLLCFLLALSLPAQAKKQKKDKVKVDVLQNEEYNECMYMNEVVISVKYKLKASDYAALTAELSNDGLNYYEAAVLDIERGNGKLIMSFDAGTCATDMRVVMK